MARLRASPASGAFLDGVNVASLALMAVVTTQLDRAAITDWITAELGVAASVLPFRFRINSRGSFSAALSPDLRRNCSLAEAQRISG